MSSGFRYELGVDVEYKLDWIEYPKMEAVHACPVGVRLECEPPIRPNKPQI